jgi:DNA anti-recombination protein RmuC
MISHEREKRKKIMSDNSGSLKRREIQSLRRLLKIIGRRGEKINDYIQKKTSTSMKLFS